MTKTDDVKWIRIVTDIFDNRKIKQIESLPNGDSIIVIWLKILTLAGSINDSGFVYFTKEIPYTDQLLATAFNRPLATVQFALDIFQKFEMIEVINDMIFVSNWEKYQCVEGLSKIREQNRIRKQRQREKQKALAESCHVTVTGHHATEIDIEEDIEEKKEDANASKKEGGKTAFRAPSIEDVEAYCKSEGFDQTDADDFVNFYEKKGWVVGKTKMKDWKAAVRNWENTERKRRGLPTIGEMRKAAEKRSRETEKLVEYPVGSGRMIPEVQARREANRDGAFVEYPAGSGKFIPVYEAEAIRKGKPINGK